MKIYYSKKYYFRTTKRYSSLLLKYKKLTSILNSFKSENKLEMIEVQPINVSKILKVHSPKYITDLFDGSLSREKMKEIGFPWSQNLIERAKLSAEATTKASYTALKEKIAFNMAGGSHHAFRNKGSGFCLLNDVAIASREMLDKKLVKKIAIIDCDVHQGDGTADIMRHENRVFTFSIHAQNNFPFIKRNSDLDINLLDKTSDAEYLHNLSIGLYHSINLFAPEFIFYLAGADPFIGDRLGKLSLSKKGLKKRDKLIFQTCKKFDIPICVTMAGGYADDINDTVDINFSTIKTAFDEFFKKREKKTEMT